MQRLKIRLEKIGTKWVLTYYLKSCHNVSRSCRSQPLVQPQDEYAMPVPIVSHIFSITLDTISSVRSSYPAKLFPNLDLVWEPAQIARSHFLEGNWKTWYSSWWPIVLLGCGISSTLFLLARGAASISAERHLDVGARLMGEERLATGRCLWQRIW